MPTPNQPGIPLDYARPMSRHPRPQPRLRLGVVSLSVSLPASLVPALSGTIIAHFRLSSLIQNQILEIMLPVALLALGLGIAGLFQRSGRDWAIFGITISLMEIFFAAACHTA